MATNYTGLTTKETIEYLGGGQSRDAIQVAGFTVPHNVWFYFRIPRTAFTDVKATGQAQAYAGLIEDIFKNANVAGVEVQPVENAIGFLVDTVTVYVQSDSGDSQGTFDISFYALDPARVDADVAKLAATLNAVEAS